MKFLITICARGGSKGVPKKNIKILNGSPLLYYTIIIAKKFSEYFNCDIDLSTDSDEIIEVASQIGLSTNYKRPVYLASDIASKVDVIKDLLIYKEKLLKTKYDYILDLDVTSPLRNLEDLLKAFEVIHSNTNAINLFSVNSSNRNPYFNMVEKKDNGYYSTVKALGDISYRQAAPKVYDMNASFYFYRRLFFDMNLNSAITDRSLIYEMPHICFDIDHPIDFEFISFLIENNKLDFDL